MGLLVVLRGTQLVLRPSSRLLCTRLMRVRGGHELLHHREHRFLLGTKKVISVNLGFFINIEA